MIDLNEIARLIHAGWDTSPKTISTTCTTTQLSTDWVDGVSTNEDVAKAFLITIKGRKYFGSRKLPQLDSNAKTEYGYCEDVCIRYGEIVSPLSPNGLFKRIDLALFEDKWNE